MSTAALRRRLSRLETAGAAGECRGCGGPRFVFYDEYDRPIEPLGRCLVCGGPFRFQYHLHHINPKPITPDTPPVAAREQAPAGAST